MTRCARNSTGRSIICRYFNVRAPCHCASMPITIRDRDTVSTAVLYDTATPRVNDQVSFDLPTGLNR